MKKINLLMGLFALLSGAAFAAEIQCKVVDGDFDNTVELPAGVTLSDDQKDTENFGMGVFSLVSLRFDLLGEQRFTKKAVSGTSTSMKIDFDYASNDRVRAVLLTEDKNLERMDALLIVTGTNVQGETDGAPLFNFRSLTFNLKCRK